MAFLHARGRDPLYCCRTPRGGVSDGVSAHAAHVAQRVRKAKTRKRKREKSHNIVGCSNKAETTTCVMDEMASRKRGTYTRNTTTRRHESISGTGTRVWVLEEMVQGSHINRVCAVFVDEASAQAAAKEAEEMRDGMSWRMSMCVLTPLADSASPDPFALRFISSQGSPDASPDSCVSYSSSGNIADSSHLNMSLSLSLSSRLRSSHVQQHKEEHAAQAQAQEQGRKTPQCNSCHEPCTTCHEKNTKAKFSPGMAWMREECERKGEKMPHVLFAMETSSVTEPLHV